MHGTKRGGGGPRKSDIVMSPDFPSEDLVMSTSPFRESEGCSSTVKSLRDQSGKASTQRPQLVSAKDPTTPDKGDLRLIRTPCCGGGSFYKLVDSLQFTHSPKKIPIPVLITAPNKSKILSRKKTAHRQKRKQWKPEEFNQLRSQSLLGFPRKIMAKQLSRDDRLIFSRIQKHLLLLLYVETYIKKALSERAGGSPLLQNQLISIDGHSRQTFMKIQKYFSEVLGLSQALEGLLANSNYQKIPNAREKLLKFIPKFLQPTKAPNKKGQTQIGGVQS